MILYLDTSALVKLFVEEADSDLVRSATASASMISTHLVAYAEACAAFARLAEIKAESGLFARLRQALDDHWAEWEIVAVDERLIRRAGELAGRYRLRGYDSVHLAAVEDVYGASRGRAEFRFSVFDTELKRAAQSAGFPLLEKQAS